MERDLKSRADRAARAFSLVEVVLALGIISFVLLTVMALMSTGLGTMRLAMDDTKESQITRQLTGQILLTPFSQLGTTFSGKTYFYDDEGSFLTNTPMSAPATTRYWATTTVTNSAYPGATVSAISSSLVDIQLQIISAPSATAKSQTTNIFNIEVPNSGS